MCFETTVSKKNARQLCSHGKTPDTEACRAARNTPAARLGGQSSCFEGHFGKILKPKSPDVRWLFGSLPKEGGFPASRAGRPSVPAGGCRDRDTRTWSPDLAFFSVWICTHHVLIFKNTLQAKYDAPRTMCTSPPLGPLLGNPTCSEMLLILVGDRWLFQHSKKKNAST